MVVFDSLFGSNHEIGDLFECYWGSINSSLYESVMEDDFEISGDSEECWKFVTYGETSVSLSFDNGDL